MQADDGMLDIPPKGAEITFALGWIGQTLVERGTFIVDEVEHSGAPDAPSIRASSADMRKGLSGKRTKSRDNITAIAKRRDLTPSVGVKLAGIRIEHIDQADESDLHFLTHLAERFDAVATVKTGHLIFVPTGQATTASGLEIPPIQLRRQSGDQHRYIDADRGAYSGVTALWNDKANAADRSHRRRCRKRPTATPHLRQRRRSPRRRPIRMAAPATRYRPIQHHPGNSRPEVFPEPPVWVIGWKPKIDATPWIITEVTHNLTNTSYTTDLQMKTRPGNPAAPY